MKKKIIYTCVAIAILVGLTISHASAYNRTENFGGARLNTTLSNNYNITTVNISSNGTQIGSALTQEMQAKIQKSLADIEALKRRLKTL